jgi:ribose transport system ATP-binding protein
MRDGEAIDTMDAKTVDMDTVVAKMVGRRIEHLYQRHPAAPGEPVLRTENLTGLGFRNVSITVRAGEIVTLSGLVGAGRTEVAKALFGYDPIEGGSFELFGRPMRHPTPGRCVDRGMAYLPEDRKGEGLILGMPLRENLVQASLRKLFPGGVVSQRKAGAVAERYRGELRIVAPDIMKKVGELSGGNQQKVVIGKWLATGCKFFIFDEPTRGIDVGAKAEIYQILDGLAQQGAGILMISSELSEVIGLSDRVYVMRDGEIVKEFTSTEGLTQDAVVSHLIAAGPR